MSFVPSVCLSHRLSVPLPLCLSACLSVRLSLCLSFCPSVSSYSICLSVCLLVYQSLCLSVCLSLPRPVPLSLSLPLSLPLPISLSLCPSCLSVPQSVCLSVCPSVCLFVRMAHESDTRATSPLKQNNETSAKEMCGKNRRKNTQNPAAKNCKPGGGNRYRSEDGEGEIKSESRQEEASVSNHRQRPQNDDGR